MKTPSVAVEFGGKTRHLIFDFNAISELEDIAGTYASNVAYMKAVRALIWAGLLAETLDKRGRETKETLSIVQVGDIMADMDEAEIKALVDAAMEARGISEVPEDERPTPATPTPQA